MGSSFKRQGKNHPDTSSRAACRRAARAVVEGLEQRVLLTSALPAGVEGSTNAVVSVTTGIGGVTNVEFQAGSFTAMQNLAADYPSGVAVVVDPGVPLGFNSPETLTSLTIGDGAIINVAIGNSVNNGNVITLTSGVLSLAPAGTLNLTNNSMILQEPDAATAATVCSTIRALITRGADAYVAPNGAQTPAWNGDGISSSAAGLATDSAERLTIACGVNTGLSGPEENIAGDVTDANDDAYTSYNGVAVNSYSVLVATTDFADVNFDGDVDLSDYRVFKAAYGSSIGNSSFNFNLDYNFDGNIDISDYRAFKGAYGDSLSDSGLANTISVAGLALPVSVLEGQTSTVRVATFTDSNTDSNGDPYDATDYTAQIDWGDGNLAAATVHNPTDGSGIYTVTAQTPAITINSDALIVVFVQYNPDGPDSPAGSAPGSISMPVRIAPPVSGISATGIAGNQINVNFTSTSTDATGFEVWRATNGSGGFAQLPGGTVSLGGSAWQFADTYGTAEATIYSYEIRADYPGGTSSFTSPVSASTQFNTGDTISAVMISANSIGVSFAGNGNPNEYFDLDRSVDGGSYSPVVTFISGATSIGRVFDYYVPSGEAVSYKVVDVTGGGSTVVGTTAPIPTIYPPSGSETGTEGEPFTLQLPNETGVPDAPASWIVNWGDGSATQTTSASVNPTHLYTDAGSYSVVLTPDNASDSLPGGAGDDYCIDLTANVADAALTATGAAISTLVGQDWTGTVAKFTDADPYGQLSEYSAMIDFGDGGRRVAGAISSDGNGDWIVTGSHTFATSGSHTVTVEIKDDGGSTATATSTANTVSATLDVITDTGVPLDTVSKHSTGGFLEVNDSDNLYQFDSSGNPIPDDQESGVNPYENALLPMIIRATSPNIGGTYTLNWSGSSIKVWMNEDKSPGVDAFGNTVSQVISGVTQFSASQETDVYVEGISVIGGQQVTLNWQPGTGGIAAFGNDPPAFPAQLDFAKLTVDDLQGPQNVPDFSNFWYQVTVPAGSNPPPNVAWSAVGGDVTSNGETYPGNTGQILWGGGAAVGKVYYSPSPGFKLERDVNIVGVSFGNNGPLTVSTVGTPYQLHGAGTASIDASAVNNATINSNVAIFLDGNGNGSFESNNVPGDDALLVTAHGPVVGGVERGDQFILMGFTQQAQMVEEFGHYIAGNANQYLTGSAQDGQLHWDGPLWNHGQASKFISMKFLANGLNGWQMYWWDDPILLGTDPSRMVLNGNPVNDVTIKFVNNTYFAVGTTDPGVLAIDNPSQNAATIRLSLNWTLNASGTIDAQGVFHAIPGVTGITTATPAFEEVESGQRVPEAAGDISDLIGAANETWSFSQT